LNLTAIIDSHQHFVDIDSFQYYWMKPELEVLNRSFLPPDVAPELKSASISKTVAVQAHPSVKEAYYLLHLAESYEFIGAVVAWVDLTRDDIDQTLEEYTSQALIRAVRHQTAENEPADWFLRQDVLRGLQAVARSGLAYDLLIRPQHLKSILGVAQKIPALKMVVEHMAKPPVYTGRLEPWASDIANLAKIPSIFCKVSELVTEANHASWTVEDLKPYIHHIIDVFGFERLMWGSGWPVCLLAATYGQTLQSTLEAIGPMNEAERLLFLGENANLFYGLQ
jgi:L-fuconolactonase